MPIKNTSYTVYWCLNILTFPTGGLISLASFSAGGGGGGGGGSDCGMGCCSVCSWSGCECIGKTSNVCRWIPSALVVPSWTTWISCTCWPSCIWCSSWNCTCWTCSCWPSWVMAWICWRLWSWNCGWFGSMFSCWSSRTWFVSGSVTTWVISVYSEKEWNINSLMVGLDPRSGWLSENQVFQPIQDKKCCEKRGGGGGGGGGERLGKFTRPDDNVHWLAPSIFFSEKGGGGGVCLFVVRAVK